MTFKRVTASILAVGCFASVGASTQAQEPTETAKFAYEDCFAPIRIGSGLLPNDINNQGTVVGLMGGYSPDRRAFRYRNGVVEDLSMQLGVGAAEANAVNDAGTIVGSRLSPFDGRAEGFILETNQPARRVTAHSVGSLASITLSDINQRGEAVGEIWLNSTGGPSCSKPVFTRPGANGRAVDVDLGRLSCRYFSNQGARSINSQGAIAVVDSYIESGFGYPSGGLMNLGTLSIEPVQVGGTQDMYPVKVNDLGMVAGFLLTPGYPNPQANLAFYNGIDVSPIATPTTGGLFRASVTGINNSGQVVGTFTSSSYPPIAPSVPFLHENGQTVDLNEKLCSRLPGNARLAQARGINESSTIIATTSPTSPYGTHGDAYLLEWRGTRE